MRRLRLASLALAAIAALVPLSADAENYCSSTVVVFSYPTGVNTNVIRCLADPAGDTGDGRIINPGSDSISVRYTVDLQIPTIHARLDGLGFEGLILTMTRAEVIAGLYAYDSDVVDLANGITSSGCVTATILDPENEAGEPLDANSFHTVDSSCPAA